MWHLVGSKITNNATGETRCLLRRDTISSDTVALTYQVTLVTYHKTGNSIYHHTKLQSHKNCDVKSQEISTFQRRRKELTKSKAHIGIWPNTNYSNVQISVNTNNVCSYEHLQWPQIHTFACRRQRRLRVTSVSYGNSLGIHAIRSSNTSRALLFKFRRADTAFCLTVLHDASEPL
jgi:hypothetical protein